MQARRDSIQAEINEMIWGEPMPATRDAEKLALLRELDFLYANVQDVAFAFLQQHGRLGG